MINETGNTENTSFTDEALTTPTEAGRAENPSGPMRELGRKGLEPLLSVLTKHQGDVTPYFDAVTKALKAAAESLKGENPGEAETFISGYFTEGADWLSQWKEKLAGKSQTDLLNFLEEEGKKSPAILFGASYFAGLILGRFGRHLGKTIKPKINIH